ncbi:Sedlin [Aulographum hederae CBS 113979]|uniref:Sedlin n=1 Tax=Aulographum hederae CBS 113979 TaxID=1176131 RepID=A0A6G1H4G2_9PEZI|nr:Sedlin [Aulographum hederae CBS 113979]
MVSRIPSIACVGVIGQQNNPLHISLFPATPAKGPSSQRSPLEFSLLLSTSLDIFTARLPSKTDSLDFGLLQAVDERLAMYGWLTNTGIKFVIVVDMEGRAVGGSSGIDEGKGRGIAGIGLRDADLKPAFRALQTAYIALLRNPFYDPDWHTPSAADAERRVGSTQITSKSFIKEVQRIGENWTPGMGSL